jgi:hypothetical protein
MRKWVDKQMGKRVNRQMGNSAKASAFAKATADRLRHEEIFNHGLRRITQILFLPADADLAAAFSIQVSVKPVACVPWAIRDGPHTNMQAGKRGIFY